MKNRTLISALVVLGLSTPIFGQDVLYEHVGVNNPTGEGFTLVASGAGGTTSAVPSDGGIAAWAIQTGAGGALWYSGDLNSAPLAQSWTLSVNMRVVTPATGTQHSFVEVRTANYIYSFWVLADAEGDQMVGTGAFLSGPFYVLEGSGSICHDYELHFSPIGSSSGVAQLSVNGVAVLPAFTSSGQSGSSVLLWGEAQLGPSVSHWNSVSFQVVPEPSSIALFMIGLVFMCRPLCRFTPSPPPSSHAVHPAP